MIRVPRCSAYVTSNLEGNHVYEKGSPVFCRQRFVSDMPMPSTRRVQLATIDEQLIEQVTQRIVEACDPEVLYLFGSAARGDMGPESDLDLLVVAELKQGERPHEKASELRRLFDGWLVSFDILVQSPGDFARTREWPGHIACIATREGTLLYRRDAHAHI